ncbi:hypothetical protein WSK_0308 [Novosphingobium sp. Rr 2-17]|uniref:ubiquinol-cytochrome C chaperone family protein n=1 Tax=Novosphingobium sp. Rr 2-17 TaxID=555793 RepID=UPI0002698B58|nr:ubiquinol-cytochrome C chaperone family protein [Novosphingobium sp. Rr 2-17]EIZ80916.1 hypothetical protein WSK_0308 [Novosphingobium sp. Rr 2-17]
MSLLSRLAGKRPDPREAVRPLWHRMVQIAREKDWYAQLGVADTVPGRFDAVTLVMALVMLRMEGDAGLIEPSARLTELFVEDMDAQLRQSGIGDLVVGKHIGKLMGVLGGRIAALKEALAIEDDGPLVAMLERNVTLIDGADSARLAAAVRDLHRQIGLSSAEALLAGKIERL